jgi:hypothetical protein
MSQEIWTLRPDPALLNELGKNTLKEQLGIVFTEVGPNYLRATMPVDHRTIQYFGMLHGGASVALAETVASTAANFVIILILITLSAWKSTPITCAASAKAPSMPMPNPSISVVSPKSGISLSEKWVPTPPSVSSAIPSSSDLRQKGLDLPLACSEGAQSARLLLWSD